MAVTEVVVVFAGTVDLEDLRAEVAHINVTGDRVCTVHIILKHNIGITGFKLDLRQDAEKLTGVDFAFTDSLVIHHVRIVLCDAQF